MDTQEKTVLFSDIVGFSRLVERDEHRVITRQQTLHTKLLHPLLTRHNGRLIKTTGDGFLCLFEAAQDGFDFATALLSGVKAFCDEDPNSDVFVYRIGLHHGPVIELEGDVFGSTVNIASRLESISKPGSICTSEHCLSKMSAQAQQAFDAQGLQRLKNIDRPIACFMSAPDFNPSHPRSAILGKQLHQQISYCTSADGCAIAMASLGQGPVLLKSPNFVTHLDADWRSPLWRHIFENLSSEHKLLRFDQRGNGLSERHPETISFDAFVDDIMAVSNTIQDDKFVLFGVSQGCASAIEFAYRHPERVKGLIFLGGFAQGANKRPSTNPSQTDLEIQMIQTGWDSDIPAFRQFFANTMIPDSNQAEKDSFDQLMQLSTSAEKAAAISRVNAQIDVTNRLGQITLPTLIMHSRGDQRVPMDQSQIMADKMPNARFVPLDSKNHLILEQDAGWPVFQQEVSKFLAAL